MTHWFATIAPYFYSTLLGVPLSLAGFHLTFRLARRYRYTGGMLWLFLFALGVGYTLFFEVVFEGSQYISPGMVGSSAMAGSFLGGLAAEKEILKRK